MKMINAAGGLSGRRLVGTLVVAAILLTVTVGAAFASGGGGHGGGGLPQLNPATFPTQLFWLVVSFGILYFMMFGVGLPAVDDVLSARDGRISWDISKADELRNESNAILAANERMLERTRAQAQEIVSRTSGQGHASARMLMDRFDIELTRRTKEAEGRVAAAKAAALGEIDRVATELASDLISRLAGLEVGSAGVADAVKVAIKERN